MQKTAPRLLVNRDARDGLQGLQVAPCCWATAKNKRVALFPRTFWEVIGAVETKCVVILLRCIRVICVLTKKACACVASERIERLLLKHLSLPQTTLVSNAEQGWAFVEFVLIVLPVRCKWRWAFVSAPLSESDSIADNYTAYRYQNSFWAQRVR